MGPSFPASSSNLFLARASTARRASLHVLPGPGTPGPDTFFYPYVRIRTHDSKDRSELSRTRGGIACMSLASCLLLRLQYYARNQDKCLGHDDARSIDDSGNKQRVPARCLPAA
jgi:hypothetical protein